MMALFIPRGGYFGRVTDPVHEQGLEVQRAPQRCVVINALFLAISGAAHRERGKPRGPVCAQAQADISIPGRVDPLSCRDAGGWTSSLSRQRLIRRMRHCPRRDLRAIRFPDPRPTAPGPFLGVCGRGVFGGQTSVGEVRRAGKIFQWTIFSAERVARGRAGSLS